MSLQLQIDAHMNILMHVYYTELEIRTMQQQQTYENVK